MESLLNKIGKPDPLSINSKDTIVNNDTGSTKMDYKSYPPELICLEKVLYSNKPEAQCFSVLHFTSNHMVSKEF